MYEVKLFLMTDGDVEKRIIGLFQSAGFSNLSNFSEVLIFRDNGDKKDCGRLWRTLFKVRDEALLSGAIAGGTWKYGDKIESLVGDFF